MLNSIERSTSDIVGIIEHASDDRLNQLIHTRNLINDRMLLDKIEFNKVNDAIIDHCGHKEEGSETFKTDSFKIVTTGKMTRAIDESKLSELQSKIPQPLFERLFKYKPSLNLTEYRYVENNEPAFYKEISKVITTKPAKTALKIEALKD